MNVNGFKATLMALAVGLLLLSLPVSDGISVKDDMPVPQKRHNTERVPPSAASSYRVSLAKPKQPLNRVPAHLQDVLHVGLTYDDADDVIHIIEPPKYFQQMKHRLQQQHQQQQHGQGGSATDGAGLWEQQRKRYVNKSLATAASATPTPAFAAAMKVKERGATKVDLQQMRRRPVVAIDDERRRSDLHTQATQKQQQQQTYLPPATQKQKQTAGGQHFHMPAGLPMEILASVRKTERLIHKNKQERGAAATGGPQAAKQRIKSKKVQTVIMEQHFEREKFQRDKEHKFGGELAQSHRHKLQRSKRDVSLPQRSYDEEKGVRLLQHIAELLQNADKYLPHDTEIEQLPHLTGEIEPTTKANQVYSLLTNSLNASDLQNRSGTIGLCRNAKDETAGVQQNLKRLSHNSTCEQEQTPSLQKRGSAAGVGKRKRFGERLEAKVGEAPSTPTKHVNKQRKGRLQSIPAATLLYDDVMTNIRNMLQATNLALLEEERAAPMATRKTDVDDDAKPPHYIPPNELDSTEHLQHLQQYLQELQQFVAYDTAHTPLTLNTHEFLSGSGTQPARELSDPDTTQSWYLINSSGSIYDADLGNTAARPTTTIFYRFPDIPNVDRYINEGRPPAAQTNAYEIV